MIVQLIFYLKYLQDNTQQFPLLAVKFYTTLSTAHSNSPLPVYDRLSRRLFHHEQLATLVDGRNPSCSRRSFPPTTRGRLTQSIIVTHTHPWR